MNQIEKAEAFKALHIPGQPLVLYNIWDAGGAKTLSDAGAPAIATGSWSVAAAQGYSDGEAIPLDFVLRIVERIAQATALPLTVDFEGGYAEAPEGVAENVKRLISTGAIGINFEDQIVGGSGLYPISTQTARIAAIREAAAETGIPLFINARTDLFLKAATPGGHPGLLPEALDRAGAYAEAGAGGFFVPGLTDPALIGKVCETCSLPVNVLMPSDQKPPNELARQGVARISFGPRPHVSSMNDLAARFKAVM